MKKYKDKFDPLPLVIGLSDGGVMKVLTQEKLRRKPKLLDKYKYFLVSIATKAKGPIYTTVRANELNLSNGYVKASLTFETSDGYYSQTFPVEQPITSIHERYSFMPMIYSYMNADSYMSQCSLENYGSDEMEQILSEVSLEIDKHKIEFSIFEIYDGDMDLRDLFTDLGVETVTDFVFYDHMVQYMCLIPDENKFELIDNRTRFEPEEQIIHMMEKLHAPYVLIPILDIEAVYMLSFYQLCVLNKIEFISICIREVGVRDKENRDYENFGEFFEIHLLAPGIAGLLEWVISAIFIVQNLFIQCTHPGYTTFDGMLKIKFKFSPNMQYGYLPKKAFPNLELFYLLDKIIQWK